MRLLLFLTVASLAGAAPSSNDIVIADFEGDSYAPWTVAGEAVGKGPAPGALPNQMPVAGYLGRGLVNSFVGGDKSTGTLTSAEFKIERKFVNFLIGGGNHRDQTCINLLGPDGAKLKTATGPNSETLRWQSWDVTEWLGKTAKLQIVDNHTGGWGHINIDHIYASDEKPRITDDRELALLRAMSSVQNAAERAAQDRSRPGYHFRAPANWINDPNGPIYYRGYYHLFYQHNPYGDAWENMHWGHARSKDLVRWEHLPIALWPSHALGEQHCFSGCAALDDKGQPLIAYTSIGSREPECWIALPEDQDLIRWKKYSGNPILTESSLGMKYYDFRDPFIFRHGGKAFMVHGGNLNAGKGGQAVVSLFEAEDGSLLKWKYKSILWQHPDAKVKNIECPLFFPLDGKFVLITSPHRECDWYIGSFDPAAGKFTAESDGMADYSGSYYAPNLLVDGGGRHVLWGWVRGFKTKGWNGCMTLPRVLTIKNGKLIQQPAKEVETLRVTGEHARMTSGPSDFSSRMETGDMFEALLTLKRVGDGTGKLTIRLPFGDPEGLAVELTSNGLNVAGTKLPLTGKENVKLRMFFDRSVMEVYVNDGEACVTKVIKYTAPKQNDDVAVFEGKNLTGTVETWRLNSIW